MAKPTPTPKKRFDTLTGLAEEAGMLAPSLIHEMRQPLTGIRAGLELLSRRLGKELTSLDDWALVLAQVERIEEIFRAYQDFLHPERNPACPFAVRPVVDRVVKLQMFRLRRLGQRFSSQSPSDLPTGYGTENALLHALTNVMVNALDALEGSQGRLAVRTLAAPNAGVQIRVSDEGPGVPKELREKIFEARFTTKEQGSGLGLAIARRMMAPFGGKVELADDDDAGRLPWAKTEFVLTLPAPPVHTTMLIR
jgi:signal transduction histidine kinase